MSGSVRGAKVHNRLAVRHNGVVVVDRSHAIAVHASGYRRPVDKRDLCGPKCLERVKCFNNSGAFGFAGDPCLVFLGTHAALLDDAEANVDDVAVGHKVSHATSIRPTGE